MGSPILIFLGLREVKELSKATQLVTAGWDVGLSLVAPKPCASPHRLYDFLSLQGARSFPITPDGGSGGVEVKGHCEVPH